MTIVRTPGHSDWPAGWDGAMYHVTAIIVNSGTGAANGFPLGVTASGAVLPSAVHGNNGPWNSDNPGWGPANVQVGGGNVTLSHDSQAIPPGGSISVGFYIRNAGGSPLGGGGGCTSHTWGTPSAWIPNSPNAGQETCTRLCTNSGCSATDTETRPMAGTSTITSVAITGGTTTIAGNATGTARQRTITVTGTGLTTSNVTVRATTSTNSATHVTAVTVGTVSVNAQGTQATVTLTYPAAGSSAQVFHMRARIGDNGDWVLAPGTVTAAPNLPAGGLTLSVFTQENRSATFGQGSTVNQWSNLYIAVENTGNAARTVTITVSANANWGVNGDYHWNNQGAWLNNNDGGTWTRTWTTANRVRTYTKSIPAGQRHGFNLQTNGTGNATGMTITVS